MADYLQSKYSEYARKKKRAFLKSVEKAHKLICKDLDTKGDDDTQQLEEQHLIKRRKRDSKQSLVEDSGGESDSFSSDNPEYAVYQDTNSMNSLMMNMYRGSPARKNVSVTSSPLNSAPGSPKVVAETDNSPFVLDRTGDTQVFQKVEQRSAHSVQSITPQFIQSPNVDESSRNSFVEDMVCNQVDLVPGFKPDEATKSTINELLPKSKQKIKKKEKGSGGQTGGNKKTKGPEVTVSKVKFADVGGNDKTLVEVCRLLVHMRHPEVYKQLGVTPPCGFLLHGPPGCGKTLLAHAIAGELELPFMKLAATEIVSGVSGDSEEKVRELFSKAAENAPCILFIDEIDAITQKRETASKDMERRIVSQLLTCMDDLTSMTDKHVLLIGATNRPDSLDPALRRAGRFDREIALGIPDEMARKRILEVLCRDLRLASDFDFQYLAHQSPGYVGADLMALAREAAMVAVNRVFHQLQLSTSQEVHRVSQNSQGTEKSDDIRDHNSISFEVEVDIPTSKRPAEMSPEQNLNTVLTWLKEQPPLTEEQLKELFITMSDFEAGLKVVQPSAKREGFATIPDVTWDDIGALHSVREELQIAILAPVRHPEKFKALGLSNPPGILLAGPPGCGKTLLAKAVANESGINFISVKGPELLNMYVGESERAVRQVFQRARNSAPCVIFFDELDALCPRRSDSGEGGSSVRVVNQLLTEMDGLEERRQVFIMGATNRPDIIDPAVLRPGRLDKCLYVGLPSAEDRLDILRTITKNGQKPKLDDDVILEEIAQDENCARFTGADLAALVREAAVAALRQHMDLPDNQEIKVTKQHFQDAFFKVRPSVSTKDQTIYEKMKDRLFNR